MITATPRSMFSWDYQVVSGSRHLADIDVSCWREKGVLTIAGEPYGVYRERPLGGKFMLEANGSILASAEKPAP